MRPRSIVQFEQLYLISLLLGVAMAVFGWEESLATARAAGAGPGFVVFVQAFTAGVMLLLVLLVSRGRSVIAKWILILLFAGGLAMMAVNPGTIFSGGLLLIVQIVQILLQLVALALLATEESRGWFRRTG